MAEIRDLFSCFGSYSFNPYSGTVAASGYCLLEPIHHIVDRVVLLGPSHRVRFYGLATCGFDEFATPLGTISVDTQSVNTALKLSQVHLLDEAHRHEHSLEVHLPFLQMTLDRFSLLPLAVGRANVSEVSVNRLRRTRWF